MRFHQLSSQQLTALASGDGGRAAIEELNASRVSIHLLLFRSLVGRWTGPRDVLDSAVATLATVQDAAPRVYRELIGDPMVGAWLARVARQDVPRQGELRQVGNLAAAAALRAGLDCGVGGWAGRGRLVIPTLGTLVRSGEPAGPVDITVADGRVGASDRAGTWLPLRRLHAEHGDLTFSVRLEDGSPYRDGYHAPPSDRLTDESAGRWQDLFDEACALLVRHLPERAVEVACGLRVIVPLVDLGDGSSRSGTARESVGAMAMTAPISAADFAVTLIHEFEHSKVSAVIDLTPLYDPDGTEKHSVPWKTEKRPVSGLIQGVFAFTRVAEAWHRFRAIPGLSETATTEFAAVREDVQVAYRALDQSSELTHAGRDFVDALRPRLNRLLAEPLSDTPGPQPADTPGPALQKRPLPE